MKNIYQQRGYDSRSDYLKCLADDFGLDLEIVLGLAQVLGPSEDWDGLVAELQDITYLKSAIRA